MLHKRLVLNQISPRHLVLRQPRAPFTTHREGISLCIAAVRLRIDPTSMRAPKPGPTRMSAGTLRRPVQ